MQDDDSKWEAIGDGIGCLVVIFAFFVFIAIAVLTQMEIGTNRATKIAQQAMEKAGEIEGKKSNQYQ